MGETNDWRLRLGGDCTDDAARWDNAAAAETLSATGPVFPRLSPFIGVLGAFTTGSNTYSIVVWGQIQQGTAVALNQSVHRGTGRVYDGQQYVQQCGLGPDTTGNGRSPKPVWPPDFSRTDSGRRNWQLVCSGQSHRWGQNGGWG